MLKFILNILKTIVLVGVVIVALSIFGAYLNSLAIWGWLTIFFSLIYKLMFFLNFVWDIPTTWTVLGISLGVWAAVWTLKGVLWAVRWWQGIN